MQKMHTGVINNIYFLLMLFFSVLVYSLSLLKFIQRSSIFIVSAHVYTGFQFIHCVCSYVCILGSSLFIVSAHVYICSSLFIISAHVYTGFQSIHCLCSYVFYVYWVLLNSLSLVMCILSSSLFIVSAHVYTWFYSIHCHCSCVY